MSPAVSSGRRGGRASSLFLLNSGNEFVGRISVVVCLGKRGGRASNLFRINGNLGRPRGFRASFALAALHNYTILTQRLGAELSAAPESAPTGKEDKTFDAEGMKFRTFG
jgi:hypothetical protein